MTSAVDFSAVRGEPVIGGGGDLFPEIALEGPVGVTFEFDVAFGAAESCEVGARDSRV